MSATTSLAVRRFRADGVPAGPPVLLIHGFASDGHTDWITTGWRSALTASSRDVLMPDLPGHGSSPAPAGADEATPSAMTAALAAVLDGLSEVDVVAYSLGARLAWELPSMAPVRRMVLGGISPTEPFAAVDVDAAVAFASSGRLPGDPLTAMIARLISGPGRDAVALGHCIEGLRREPFAPSPGQLTVPTRFVAGQNDPVSDGIERLVGMVPGSDLVLVPGDHAAALRGAAFSTAARSFLDAG